MRLHCALYLLQILTILRVSLIANAASSAAVTSSSSTATASAQPIPGWSYLGCYHDHEGTIRGSERLLGNATTSYTNMNLVACVRYCGVEAVGAPYVYLGVEDGHECWCGSNLNLIAGNYVATDSSCNLPCANDTTELCGGFWYINVYSALGVLTPTSQVSTAMPTVSAPKSGTPLPSASSSASSNSSGTSAGTIAAAVIAGVFGLLLIVIGVVAIFARRRKRAKANLLDPQNPVQIGQSQTYQSLSHGASKTGAGPPNTIPQLGGTPYHELPQHAA